MVRVLTCLICCKFSVFFAFQINHWCHINTLSYIKRYVYWRHFVIWHVQLCVLLIRVKKSAIINFDKLSVVRSRLCKVVYNNNSSPCTVRHLVKTKSVQWRLVMECILHFFILLDTTCVLVGGLLAQCIYNEYCTDVIIGSNHLTVSELSTEDSKHMAVSNRSVFAVSVKEVSSWQ